MAIGSVSGQSRQARFAFGAVIRTVTYRYHASFFYRWRYSGPIPERLLIAPIDLRTADPTNALDLYAGRFVFAGDGVDVEGFSVFDVEPPHEAWARELHGFSWLRHLRAADMSISRSHARSLVDEWIRMVAINRLTGHSGGFFSVYTLPPNQAVSVESQIEINEKRTQVPPRRNVSKLILRKSQSLLQDITPQTAESLHRVTAKSLLTTAPAAATDQISSQSVSLVVTSPPFLKVVDYAGDNWLRCWFAGIDAEAVPITMSSSLNSWQAEMTAVFHELRRVLRPGGHVAFEVGEVCGGTVKLEETVITAARDAGLAPLLVLINQQEFTKTANCWGVDNNAKGTNSNRIVLLRKDD